MSIYTAEQQAANRQKWVAGLRSAEFPQGKGALRGHHDVTGVEEFCCLGVACELAVREGVVRRASSGYWDYQLDEEYEENGGLPTVVQDWLGLAEPAGRLKDRIEYTRGVAARTSSSLIGLNDDAGWDFNKIADAIEAGRVLLQGEPGSEKWE